MHKSNDSQERALSARKRWEPMVVAYVGHVGDIVKGGGGKLTTSGGDPGEARKEVGSGR